MLLSGLAMVTFMLFLTGNYGTLLPPGFCACALINRAIVLTFSEINAVYQISFLVKRRKKQTFNHFQWTEGV